MGFKHLANKLWLISPVVAVSVTMLFCTFVYAGETPTKPFEAWQKALLYSKDHPVIAFAVYGKTIKSTARENAEKIKQYFATENITSYYFLAMEDRMGSGVSFFIQGVSYGPVGLANAFPVIKTVIAHYKEEYPAKR